MFRLTMDWVDDLSLICFKNDQCLIKSLQGLLSGLPTFRAPNERGRNRRLTNFSAVLRHLKKTILICDKGAFTVYNAYISTYLPDNEAIFRDNVMPCYFVPAAAPYKDSRRMNDQSRWETVRAKGRERRRAPPQLRYFRCNSSIS